MPEALAKVVTRDRKAAALVLATELDPARVIKAHAHNCRRHDVNQTCHVRFTFQSLFARPWPHGPWASHELAQLKRCVLHSSALVSQTLRGAVDTQRFTRKNPTSI